MQVDLDQQCSQIIARRQPTAIDLRMVLTVVKVVNELERIGDEISWQASSEWAQGKSDPTASEPLADMNDR
jgi:phosphate uptake regulator